jgi:hypothetical protein
MTPILELRATNIKGLSLNRAKKNVRLTDLELVAHVTHWGAAITASTRLEEKKRPVRSF